MLICNISRILTLYKEYYKKKNWNIIISTKILSSHCVAIHFLEKNLIKISKKFKDKRNIHYPLRKRDKNINQKKRLCSPVTLSLQHRVSLCVHSKYITYQNIILK